MCHILHRDLYLSSEVVYFKKKLKSVFVRDDIRTKGCRYVETVYNNE
jgi:hypothetical protein